MKENGLSNPVKKVKEAIDAEGFLGLFKGGLTSGALGTTGALILGFLASLIFKSKSKS